MEATQTLPAETTSVVKIEEFKSLMTQAPIVLAENKISFSKAIEKGNELIALAKHGMNDIIDTQLAAYIDKVKKTKKSMNEKRSPFTQMMTIVAKEFTTLEGSLDAPIDTLQSLRDGYATKIMKDRQEAERQAQLRLAKEQEAIEIERLYRIGYATAIAEYILNFKSVKNTWFDGLILSNVDTASNEISKFGNNLSDAQFIFDVQISLTIQHHSIEEKVLITGGLAQQLCYSAMDNFKTSISEFKRELVDMLPSKKNQLEELERQRLKALELQRQEAERQRLADAAAAEARKKAAEADAENKIRLEEEALQANIKAELERQENEAKEKDRQRLANEAFEAERLRKSEEDAKLQEKARLSQLKAEADATVQATGQSVSAMVDNQADLFTEAPKVKEGYNILVINPAGYLQLISFWFENEGKNLTNDKIESMSIARIKVFCEKYAVKNDVTIESKLLVYEPVYKAK